MVQLLHPRRTPRLTLRRFAPEDLDNLAAILADEGVNRYLYSEPRTREEARAALTQRLERPEIIEETNLLNVAVVLRDTNRLIGDFMLRWSEDEHHQGEMGGSLHPSFHFQGFATEVYRELLVLGFDEFGLHRITAQCDGRNLPSVRSLSKAGLHEEAHFVENEFVKGEWTDEIVMAIRQREWAARP